MSFLKSNHGFLEPEVSEDPVSSVANLFDVSVVFIVALFFALFMTYNTLDLFNSESEIVITSKAANGDIKIVTKKGKEVKIEKVTQTSDEGKGVKLGTAYQLENGKVIYVPED